MSDRSPLTVHVLGSSAIVRDCLTALLSTQDSISTAAIDLPSREPLRVVPGATPPDVFLAALPGPEVTDPHVLGHAGRLSRIAPVVILGFFSDRGQVTAAITAGARGCVSAQASSENLIDALRRVAAGHGYICPILADVMFNATVAPAAASGPPARLSTREREVLQLVAQGRTNAQIAVELSVSVKTVNAHRANLMRKLGTRNASTLMREAIRRGLLPG